MGAAGMGTRVLRSAAANADLGRDRTPPRSGSAGPVGEVIEMTSENDTDDAFIDESLEPVDETPAEEPPPDVDGDGSVEDVEDVEETVGPGPPDVLLDVPNLSVHEIALEVEDLRAHIALQAELLELLKLNVGADVTLGRVSLKITEVQAQALLKVRLDRVAQIIDRVLITIDRNPRILEHLVGAIEPALEGVGSAVGEVGAGVGRATGELGRGAGEALGEVGRGAGEAVGEVGRGAGETVGEVGDLADELTEDLNE